MRSVREMRVRHQVLLTLALAVAGIGLFGRMLASCAYSNAGMLALRRATSMSETGAEVLPDLSRAERLLRRAIEIDDRNTGAHRGLALVFWKQGAWEQAGEAWRRGGMAYEDFLVAGEQRARAGELEAALDWYRRAIAVAPRESDPYVDLGRLLAEMSQEEQGLSALDRAIALNSFHDAMREITAHSARAHLLYKLGRKYEAADEYQWVVVRKPDDYWANLTLGVLAWELDRDVARAEALLLRACEIDPMRKWAYSRLGDLYREIKRPADALEMYLRVLAIDPGDTNARKQAQLLGDEGCN